MNRATPQMRSVALRLINYETLKNDASETGTAATFPMTERLRPHLATLMGNGGFRALLARALVLASAEVSWLRKVIVNADGALEGLETPYAQLKPAEFRDGQVVLLAQLLRLRGLYRPGHDVAPDGRDLAATCGRQRGFRKRRQEMRKSARKAKLAASKTAVPKAGLSKTT